MSLLTLNQEKLKNFEIELPGPWIAGDDRDWAFQTQMLLHTIICHFQEAVLSLNLFEPLDIEKMIQHVEDGEVSITRNK